MLTLGARNYITTSAPILCSWIGSQCQVGRMSAFGLSVSDFNSKSRFGILMKKTHPSSNAFFCKKWFSDFLLALYRVIFYFILFWRFASTMVALTSLLGKSVPDGGKWGRFGKPRTIWFTCDHRQHVKRSLTYFVRPSFTTSCMVWRNNCSRAKRQNDVILLTSN